MPSTAAGLCSGASALNASMSPITSGVTRVDLVNRSPMHHTVTDGGERAEPAAMR
jgi:hypothetical protein